MHILLKLLAVLILAPLVQASAMSVSPTHVALASNATILLHNPSALPVAFSIEKQEHINIEPAKGTILPQQTLHVTLQRREGKQESIPLNVRFGDVYLRITVHMQETPKQSSRWPLHIIITTSILAICGLFIGGKIYKPSSNT